MLHGRGLLVATLRDAALPASSELPPHLDAQTDARRNAEDCVVECLVMSRCAGLLCTWSHVSVGAVYLSDQKFLSHSDCGWTPPSPSPSPG